ncbi:MAG: fumarate reductase/succinate dehydrogenase flavoprotein subunit [Myxococcales bacterium]|nr:fumarate reductase/succinate dehydrogenase flavoprotein subunit [Myxococcales bacterium]
MKLDARVPDAPVEDAWRLCKRELGVVSPANKRRYHVVVVGAGLAGASAAASLAELGYHVSVFCFHDSPRRAHSIAAQGGINAAKNYQNDDDSVWRLFYDTIKGGDFRSREANVHRLAQTSMSIIDQAVAQGVPFAREYGGYLANRSFGGALVSRTFYARGQTGQQLLLGAYSAMSKQVRLGQIRQFTSHEMLDVVVHGERARGIVTRDLRTGEVRRWAADAVVLATGGYSNVYYLSTNAKKCNVTATFRAWRRGAGFANPSFTQIHPTCIPRAGHHQSKLTLMSESLRNDGRVWVPARKGDDRRPRDIPEAERDYFLERMYPSFGNLVPRDVASRAAKRVCDEGSGVGPSGLGVFLDFADAVGRLGKDGVDERYGNLFEMYEQITGEDPHDTPMRIFPAPHYTMGGLWVDYHLMSTIEGLFVLGEANFSDHGANRLGASALMQGLADGYFVLPYTIGDYLARITPSEVDDTHEAFHGAEDAVQTRLSRLLSVKGTRSADSFHRELGTLLWDACSVSRSREGLQDALSKIPKIRDAFWADVSVPGTAADLNLALEQAGRVADFLDFAEVMVHDALAREESCGAHFRVEHQTPDGEALRHDDTFSHVAVWEHRGSDPPTLHTEPLAFRAVTPSQRSYQ